MMHKLIVLLVIAVLRISAAAVAILPHVEPPPEFAGQKGCYIPEIKRVIKYNRPYSPRGFCVRYTCKTTNETYFETLGFQEALMNVEKFTAGSEKTSDEKIPARNSTRCRRIAVSAGCHIVKGNKAFRFRKCCDTVRCRSANSPLHG